MKLVERDALASSWRLMQSSAQTWSEQFSLALSAQFAADLAHMTSPTQFQTHVLAFPDKQQTLGVMNFSLVEDTDIKQAIDSQRWLQRLMPDLEQTLAELDALISSAQGLSHVMPESDPLRPEVFTRILQKLMLTTTADTDMVELWLKHLAKPLSFEIRQIYKKTTKALEQARVPAARYYYRAPPESASRPAALTASMEADFFHSEHNHQDTGASPVALSHLTTQTCPTTRFGLICWKTFY